MDLLLDDWEKAGSSQNKSRGEWVGVWVKGCGESALISSNQLTPRKREDPGRRKPKLTIHHPLHPFLPIRTLRIQERPTQSDPSRPNTEGLHYVRPASDASI